MIRPKALRKLPEGTDLAALSLGWNSLRACKSTGGFFLGRVYGVL